jgi:hypothetical protein
VLVGAHAEVLDGLTRVLGATEEERVGTSRLLLRQLVQRQGLATGSLDAGAGGRGETEGRHSDLGDLEESVVVRNGADYDDRLVVAGILDVGGDAREGDRGAVYAAHKQSAEDDLVEGRVGAA